MDFPNSLNYTASKSVIKYKRFNVRTTGTNSGVPSSVIRMKLPNGLINLSSFNLCFDLTISGLVVNNVNYFNIKMPHGHKVIKEIKCFVNNQQVSGKCENMDILYNALLKLSVSEDYCNSRLNEHSLELIDSADDFGILKTNPQYSSKSASYVVSDFLGLFKSGDKSIIDCNLWGQVELEFIINDVNCMAQYVGGGGSNAGLQMKITNVEGFIDRVVEISPAYNQLVSMMLKNRTEPLMYCYQNMVSTISSSGNGARLQCQSQSIDGIVCCPLDPAYNTLLSSINPDTQLSAKRYQYNSGKVISQTDVSTTKNCNLQISINGNCYPDVPINNALHVVNNSIYNHNLLFNDISAIRNGGGGDILVTLDPVGGDYVRIPIANTPVYNRSAFLNENFIWYQPLCHHEGYINKQLTGYDTEGRSAEIIVVHNAIAAGGSLFIGALTTSCLSLDPVSKQMTVIE